MGLGCCGGTLEVFGYSWKAVIAISGPVGSRDGGGYGQAGVASEEKSL